VRRGYFCEAKNSLMAMQLSMDKHGNDYRCKTRSQLWGAGQLAG